MKSDRFYLACLRDTVGTNVSFHGLSGGYTSDIDKARSYSREEAQSEWNSGRSFDLPPLCADKLMLWHLPCGLPIHSLRHRDCDRMLPVRRLPETAMGRKRCVLAHRYWRVYHELPAGGYLRTPGQPGQPGMLPYSVANAAKRRTFAVNKIDRRRMIQAAGLITPEHIKRYRRRKPSSKTRMNCPSCGRIHWQHDPPHEFAGCTNISCDQWRSSLEQCA